MHNMKEMLQDFEQGVPDFIREELDKIADLVVRNERHELTKIEQGKLSDKLDRYGAYQKYIENKVQYIRNHHQ